MVPAKKDNPTLAKIKRYLVDVKLSNAVQAYFNSLNDGRSQNELVAINQCVNKLGGIKLNPVERDFKLLDKYLKIQTLLIANGILLNSWVSLIQTHCFSSGMIATTQNVASYDEFLETVFSTFPFVKYEATEKQLLQSFEGDNSSTRTFFLQWINAAQAYPFVEASVIWIKNRLLQECQSNGFQTRIDHIRELNSLSNLRTFVEVEMTHIPMSISPTGS